MKGKKIYSLNGSTFLGYRDIQKKTAAKEATFSCNLKHNHKNVAASNRQKNKNAPIC